MTSGLHRRHVLSGATAAAVGLPVLAACGNDDPVASDPGSTPSSSSDEESGSTDARSTGQLSATSDVPVGGCAVFADQKVVVTQPTRGEFKAFSSVCTHKGCTVEASTDGDIPCPCHGSRFSLTDGSVVEGPATTPLAEVAIAVEGDSITLA